MNGESTGPDSHRSVTDGGWDSSRSDPSNTGTGLESNVAAALSYVLFFVSGIAMYVLEDDAFVKFHAAQSIVVFGALAVANVVVGSLLFALGPVAGLLNGLIGLLMVGLWAFLIVMAYQGQRTRIPVAADVADSLTARVEGKNPSSRSGSSSTTHGDGPNRSDHSEAVETLRERYAEGKLGDEEFEQKLERLLEREDRENNDEFEDFERSR